MQDIFDPVPLTPPGELSPKLNFQVKRFDLHPLGSHKYFAAANQIKALKESGKKGVLATSGNAGITAAYFAKELGVDLYVLISPSANPTKIQEILDLGTNVFLSNKPGRFTNYISSKYGLHNLRPSMDDLAVKGFEKFGEEIAKVPCEEIYTFTTSGASFLGLYRALKKASPNNLPRLHSVRGAAGLLGIHATPRQKEMRRIMEETGGREFEISSQQLQEFKTDFPTLQLSDESLSSLIAALSNNANENSLVISTGKAWQDAKTDLPSLPTINSFDDCAKFFS